MKNPLFLHVERIKPEFFGKNVFNTLIAYSEFPTEYAKLLLKSRKKEKAFKLFSSSSRHFLVVGVSRVRIRCS
jgi:hypothetical protein